jgi:broad specificity phosphatase PhoE
LSAPGTTTTVILVRHAERAKEPGESALTPEGRQRAQALVAAIGDREITALYSPDRGRNRETVQPLATHLGVTITLIPEARLSNTRRFADELVQEVLSKHAGGMVVWAVSRFKKPLMANPPAVLISRKPATRGPAAFFA